MLGSNALNLKTLWLSPRDKDMEVFDGITQHPVFSRLVERVVLDPAQFLPLSLQDYIIIFSQQILQVVMESGHQSALDLYKLLWGKDYIPQRGHVYEGLPRSQEPFLRFRGNSRLMEGYNQYMQLAYQQKNLLRRSWFDRACRGMTALVGMKTVAVSYGWHKILGQNIWGEDLRRLEIFRGPKDTCEINWDELFYTADGQDSQEPITELGDVDYTTIRPAVIPMANDNCRELSPVARSWPTTNLVPWYFVRPPWVNLKKMFQATGLSDGYLEHMKLVQLLNASGQKPSRLEFPGSHPGTWGYCQAIIFDTTQWPASSSLTNLRGHLNSIDVRIQFPRQGSRRLEGLKSFIHQSPGLRRLSLKMPYCDDYSGLGNCFTDISHMFPLTPKWQDSSLEELHLSGFCGSYHDFISLFFWNLTNLKTLQLSYSSLTGGRWEDLVEGFRHCDHLSHCEISAQLFHTHVGGDSVQCYPTRMGDISWDFGLPGVERTAKLARINAYINAGGRHPALNDTETDADSAKYLIKLNRILDRLREE